MRALQVVGFLALIGCSGKSNSESGAVSGTAGASAGGTVSGTASGTTSGTPVGTLTTVTTPTWDPADFDHVYDVGPGQPYATPNEVPWEALAPSSLVRIHHRAEPYASKWVINTVATEDEPVVVVGLADGAGNRPVITGDGATTRLELSYWNEERSVIKVGGSNLPSDDLVPSWIAIESLEIRSAHPDYGFTDDAGGASTYVDNAAAVHVEIGEHITLRDCVLHDSGNGLFSGSQSSELLIAGNAIYGNGVVGSIYHHNNYTESRGITFDGNHFGGLRPGAGGNNLKDRSAGLVVRYNWIEGGNRQLDLVDTDHAEVRDDARYRDTWVYGNVLVEPEGDGNSQVVHYGGDSGDEAWYRAGVLHFSHNTVVSERAGNTTLVRLSSSGETADMRNNIVAVGGTLGLVSEHGDVTLSGNWLEPGWVDAIDGASGTIDEISAVAGADPGFVDAGGHDFGLTAASPCVDAAVALEAGAPAIGRQVTAPGVVGPRPDDGSPDCGAIERP